MTGYVPTRGTGLPFAVVLLGLLGTNSAVVAQNDDAQAVRLQDGWYTLTTAAGSRTLTAFYYDYGRGEVSQLMAGAVRTSDKTSEYRETGSRWYYDGLYLRLEGDRRINLCRDVETGVAAAMVRETTDCHWSIMSADGGRTYVVTSETNGHILAGRYLELRIEENDSPTPAQRWEIRN